jgi:hypothetical protein
VAWWCAHVDTAFYTFVPTQLWAKPLVDGAVAVLLANRGGGGDPAVTINVAVADLPGVAASKVQRFNVRDVWQHKDIGKPVLSTDLLVMSAAPRNSAFYVLEPATAAG